MSSLCKRASFKCNVVRICKKVSWLTLVGEESFPEWSGATPLLRAHCCRQAFKRSYSCVSKRCAEADRVQVWHTPWHLKG